MSSGLCKSCSSRRRAANRVGGSLTGSVTIGGLKSGMGCGLTNLTAASKKREAVRRALVIADALTVEATDGCYKSNALAESFREAAKLIREGASAYAASP